MMPAPCTCSRPTELPPPVHAMGHHAHCRYRQAYEEFHAAVQAGLAAEPLLRKRREWWDPDWTETAIRPRLWPRFRDRFVVEARAYWEFLEDVWRWLRHG